MSRSRKFFDGSREPDAGESPSRLYLQLLTPLLHFPAFSFSGAGLTGFQIDRIFALDGFADEFAPGPFRLRKWLELEQRDLLDAMIAAEIVGIPNP